MLKVFISVPMHDRSEDEAWKDIKDAFEAIPKIFPNQELCMTHNTACVGPEYAGRLYYLGTAIQIMDQADVVYFGKGWENAKGCQVEHYICELYGIQRVEA